MLPIRHTNRWKQTNGSQSSTPVESLLNWKKNCRIKKQSQLCKKKRMWMKSSRKGFEKGEMELRGRARVP